MATTPRTRAPSAASIAAAVAALTPVPVPVPAPRQENSLAEKIIGGAATLIGAIILALLFWVGNSIGDLSKSVTLMSANVDNLQKAIADLQQGQGATSKTTSDLQAGLAASGARTTAIENDVTRVKERVRMLEGQRPLNQTQ